MSDFVLTEEQENILDIFASPSMPDLGVVALAGAGKTTLLVELGHELSFIRPDSTAYYLTFNSRNAKEVKEKFAKSYGGRNVVAKTIHSLAWSNISRDPEWNHLIKKMKSHREPLYKIRGSFVQGSVYGYLTSLGKHRVVREGDMYYAARRTIGNFCKSDEKQISHAHVPLLENLPEDDHASQDEYARIVLPIARRLWDDILNPDGVAAVEHDHYLKVWQLTDPVIGKPGDVILYDEAQDAKPCIVSIIYSQDHCQKVAVGDHYQAIYYFTGAINALRNITKSPEVKEATLTTSWRFGANVARSATDMLRYIGCDDLTMKGNPKVDSLVYAYSTSPPADIDAYITRSNAEAITVLVKLLSSGLKAHAVMDVKTVVNTCDDLELMMAGKSAKKTAELRDVEDISELQGLLDKERSEGKKILSDSALYNIILDEGPANIRHTVEQTVPASKADVVVSTIHKAKGMEWDNVALVWDNYRSIPRRRVSTKGNRKPWGDYFTGNQLAEQMLLYVAITRARKRMYIPADIARIMGITVDNEDSFPNWGMENALDYIRSGGDLVPFREGKEVEVPEEMNDLAIRIRTALMGDSDWPGVSYTEKQMPDSEIYRHITEDDAELVKGGAMTDSAEEMMVSPALLKAGLERMG